LNIGPDLLSICGWSWIQAAASGKSASTQTFLFAAQENPIQQLIGLGNHLRCDNLLSVTFHVIAL